MTTLYRLTGRFLQLAQLAANDEIANEIFLGEIEGIEGQLQLDRDQVARFLMLLDESTWTVERQIVRLQAQIDRLQRRRNLLAFQVGKVDDVRVHLGISEIQRVDETRYLVSLGLQDEDEEQEEPAEGLQEAAP